MCIPDGQLNSIHDRFLALLPKIETHGKVVFRQLHPSNKEEVLQEMRALAWKWFLRLTQRGKDAAQFLSTFNTFLAYAIRNGRRITGNEKAKDVLCRSTQRRHGFTVQPLPTCRASFEQLYSEVHGQRDHDAFEERLKDNTMTPVPEQAAFRIDWPAWLQTRGQRDRRMIGDLLEGQQGKEVSRKFGISPARLSQLRRAFRADWVRYCNLPDDAKCSIAA